MDKVREKHAYGNADDYLMKTSAMQCHCDTDTDAGMGSSLQGELPDL